MVLCGEDSSLALLPSGWLPGFLVMFVTVLVAGLLLLLPSTRNFLWDLFRRDQVTQMVGVQFWVVLTTLLLVVRFLLDLFGPWDANRSVMTIIITIGVLNYTLVHYTIGLMQLSAARPNDYFQVWAVLLVTLQYSVKIGRPYDRSKQIPLLDLMSSIWTANLLRVQTLVYLKISLWLIWALNAARIISYFSTTEEAEGINQGSNRFIADYMSYEHELTGGTPISPDSAEVDNKFNMKSYKYLVLGEGKVLEDIREGRFNPEKTEQAPLKRRRRVVRLDPDNHKELITVGKIFHHVDAGLLGSTAEGANRLKDLCLSFALYKLLRRRFYDLPVHEARLRKPWEKIRRLVFEYVLQDDERAFRIISMELSFLQDLFYSKHATMFASGFPILTMALSLSLVGAVGYIAYPVRYIPERIDPSDRNRITHGVFVTRVIIFLIVVKELAEMYLYFFSRWAKILMLCSYVKHRSMRHWLVERVMRALLCLMNRGSRRDVKISQHNLVISDRRVKIRKELKLQDCTKKGIFKSIQNLGPKLEKLKMEPEKEQELELEKELVRLDLYIPSDSCLLSKFKWALEFEAATHKIIVWHIATCLCEIRLAAGKAKKLGPSSLCPRPFIKKPEIRGRPDRQRCSPTATEQDGTEDNDEAKRWEHYITAASLSNYCMYLVTKALVPDNGIVARNVIKEVCREINHVKSDGSRPRSMQDVHDRLMKLADMADEDKQTPDEGVDIEAPMATADENKQSPGERADLKASMVTESSKRFRKKGAESVDIGNSLTRKGARLAKELLKDESLKDCLWEQLADFWTGFLLYLAVFTRANKHRALLGGRRMELMTHLWALLSHAGCIVSAANDHTFLDAEDLETLNPLS